jgi:hypothetical protein
MQTCNCWLCGSLANKITDLERPQYFHCSRCDLIFIDEHYILSTADEKKRYLLHNNTYENKGYLEYLKGFISNAITPFKQEINNGLDFGCGPTPVLSQLLSEQGIAMDHYDPLFYPALVFDGQQYELIACTEVLEHVRHPFAVLKLLSKHLHPRGILSIMTQFHQQQPFNTWWYRQDKTHICFYSPKTFRWIATHLNLNVVYCNERNICVLRNI